MEKRVTFNGWLLPLVLIAPQVMISAIFSLPSRAGDLAIAVYPRSFGLCPLCWAWKSEFLISDKYYRASFITTAVFSLLVTLAR